MKTRGIGDNFEKAAEAHFLLENVLLLDKPSCKKSFNPKSEEWFGFDPFNEEDGIFRYLPDDKSLLQTKLEKARKTGKVTR